MSFSACAGGDDDPSASGTDGASATSTVRDATATSAPRPRPAGSPEAAVEQLLAAEADGTPATSFRLLSPAARRTYADVDDWARRRSELPAITDFDVVSSEGPKVTAIVRHDPGLDPFVGLRAAQERQVWTAVEVDGGWVLDAEPAVTPTFPPPSDAAAGARVWLDAVDRCDTAAATALQAVPVLHGDASVVKQICDGEGPMTTGRVTELAGGLSAQDLVAQYGPETFEWARVVPVSGRERPFSVVLAPIGDRWSVVAVQQQ